MWKGLLLFLVAVGCYAVGLVVSLPTAFVLQQLEPKLPRGGMPLHLTDPQGTLWNGQATLSAKPLEGRLAWVVQPGGLVRGELPLSVDFLAAGTALTVQLIGHLDRDVQATLAGRLALAALDPMLRQHQLSLPGEVNLQAVRLDYDAGTAWLRQAEGRLDWPGGEVSYRAGREQRVTQVPPLTGVLSLQGEDLHLAIDLAETGKNLIEIRLGRDGTARVEVRRRLVDVLQLPVRQTGTEETIVFKVQQRLVRG